MMEVLDQWGLGLAHLIQIGLITFLVLSLLILFQWIRLQLRPSGEGTSKSSVGGPITVARNRVQGGNETWPASPTATSSPVTQPFGPGGENFAIFTLDKLKIFNGAEKDEIYIAISGKIFDVTPSEALYGPGQPYHALAGHDAAVALARRSLKMHDVRSLNTDELNREEQKRLEIWRQTFERRYQVVGFLNTHPFARKRKYA